MPLYYHSMNSLPLILAFVSHIHSKRVRIFNVPTLTVMVLSLGMNSGLHAVTEADFQRRSVPGLPYRLYVPRDYNPSIRYPLVVFLHGLGECGDNNETQLSNRANGAFVFAEQAQQAFVMMPQTKDNWIAENRYIAVMQAIDQLRQEFNIDNDRLYLTGLSIGGWGTWSFLSKSAARFAAGVPAAGHIDNKWVQEPVDQQALAFIARVPVWAYYATDDGDPKIWRIQALVKRLRALGGNPIHTEVDKIGHTAWEYAYSNPFLIEWLFAQRKGTSPQKTPYVSVKPPLGTQVYDAGFQKSVTLRGLTEAITKVTKVSCINQTSQSPESSAVGTLDWYGTVDLVEGLNLITILARAPNFVPNVEKTCSTYFSTKVTVLRRSASSWLFDFGDASLPSGPFWNNVTSSAAGSTVTNAITSDGVSSAVSLTIESPFSGTDTAGINASNVYPSTAQRDSFSVKNWETAMIRIKGLIPSAPYSLRFFASAPIGDRVTRYRVENVSARLDVGGNTSRTAVPPSVAATPQGELLIRVTTDDGVGFGHLGAFELSTSTP